MQANAPRAELTDSEWIDAVASEMRRLDPQLQPELALEAARELAVRPRWRDMSPVEVAVKAFG